MGGVIGAVGSVGTVVGDLGSIFQGSSTPGADKATDAREATCRADIRNITTPGTATRKAFVDLVCSSGDNSVLAEYRILDRDAAPGGCGFGRQDARDYAAAAVGRIRALALAQNVNVGVGGGLAPGTIQPPIPSSIGGISTGTLLLVGAVILFFALRKK